jgi:hypothetical protein
MYILQGHPSIFDSANNGLRPIIDTQLLQNTADVILDCFLTDE